MGGFLSIQPKSYNDLKRMSIVCFVALGMHCNCVYDYLTNVIRDYLDIHKSFSSPVQRNPYEM